MAVDVCSGVLIHRGKGSHICGGAVMVLADVDALLVCGCAVGLVDSLDLLEYSCSYAVK